MSTTQQPEAGSMIKNSVARVQKYLDRLAAAKRYNQECIHSFLDGGDAETSLLVSDLKALLQLASAAISTTTPPAEEAPSQAVVSQSRTKFDAWIRTHEEGHGAVDEASAWAAWSACSLMQAKQGGQSNG